LTNNDYALAWISVPGDYNDLVPVTMDGTTTMSRREQDECITALLATGMEGEEKYNIAARAAELKEPVIYRDILKGLNSGPFKNTPLAAGTDCIALPLVHNGEVLAVMTICSISPDSFSPGETRLLEAMSRDIGFAVSALAAEETGRTLARLQAAQNKAFTLFHDLVMVIDAAGIILEAAPSVAEKLNCATGTLIGKGAAEIFRDDSSQPLQLPSAKAGNPESLSYEHSFRGKEYMVHISPLETLSNAEQFYLLVARDISEQKKHRRETMKASRLAAMGEISVGVTNELNNLTNGLINYTQILSDEMKESGTTSQQSGDLLKKLMGEGEKISQVVQQLLFFNGGSSSHGTETLRINKIIEDSLALTRYQFRNDAIDVATGFPDNIPPVRANVQELQHIFINLLSNARYALNQRYPGQDPQKRIEITGEVQARNGHHCLRVACTDFGVGIDPGIISKVFNPFFSTKPEGIGTGLGLSICRSIIEDYRGILEIESTPGDHTTITMELPITA
jgi:PAS domain S-box-containing protein